MRSAAAHDPIAHPLTYPGRLPEDSGLLTGDGFVTLREAAGRPPFDDVLHRAGRLPLGERTPVLAVGSNAAPAQLRRKLTGRADTVVPMTYARVSGLVPGVSAHVSRPGYVPAAPLLAPGESARLIVLWLDEAQTAAVDRTEPNYRRVRLPATVAVSVPGLGRLGACDVYAGRHGCLAGPRGAALRLAAQPVLIAGLLADSPALARMSGARTAAEFVASARRSAALRDRVRDLWRRTGRVLPQPGLPLLSP